MFVRNPTRYACRLARGRVADDLAVCSLGLELCYALGAGGALELVGELPRSEVDPPDVRGVVMWRGASVTAAGPVRGPSSPPFVRAVCYQVDGTELALVVLGARRWERVRGGRLEPTEPERFDELPMGWEHAFGGRFTRPPGLAPGTDLPHPGGEVAYVWNPNGVGLYPDAAAAEGGALPRIELASERIRSWTDRPMPGGLAPCPALGALRLPRTAATAPSAAAAVTGPAAALVAELFGPDLIRHALRMQHHAPGALVLERLPLGSRLALDGLGEQRLECRIPEPPVEVQVRRGRHRECLPVRVRSAHLCAEPRLLRVTFAFSHRYSPSAPPSWIEVRAARSTP